MKEITILVVDDDPSMLRLLKANLEVKGYKVLIAQDGLEAIQSIEAYEPNLTILDIMLPKLSGRDVCKHVREWYKAPIIMLSALGRTADKTQCLDMGADDYITKPFAVNELLARIRAALRRVGTPEDYGSDKTIECNRLSIDLAMRRVVLDGKHIPMTPIEYSLLRELAINAGKILTQSQLLTRVWGEKYEEEKEYLREYISHLRSKIETDPSNPEYILTIKSVGYMFRELGV